MKSVNQLQQMLKGSSFYIKTLFPLEYSRKWCKRQNRLSTDSTQKGISGLKLIILTLLLLLVRGLPNFRISTLMPLKRVSLRIISALQDKSRTR